MRVATKRHGRHLSHVLGEAGRDAANVTDMLHVVFGKQETTKPPTQNIHFSKPSGQKTDSKKCCFMSLFKLFLVIIRPCVFSYVLPGHAGICLFLTGHAHSQMA